MPAGIGGRVLDDFFARGGASFTPSLWPASNLELDAGIDVHTTVNIQHLESLNDKVFELTGVRVRETFPDRLLDEADGFVLTDLPRRATGADRPGTGVRARQAGGSATSSVPSWPRPPPGRREERWPAAIGA